MPCLELADGLVEIVDGFLRRRRLGSQVVGTTSVGFSHSVAEITIRITLLLLMGCFKCSLLWLTLF